MINPAAGRGRGRTQLPHDRGRARGGVDADVHIRRVGRPRRRRTASPPPRSTTAAAWSRAAATAGVPAGRARRRARRRPRDRARGLGKRLRPPPRASRATTRRRRRARCARARVQRVDLVPGRDRRRHAARGRRPSPTRASTPRPTAGRTRSTGRAARRSTCSRRSARSRPTGRDGCASPSTTTCSRPTAWLVAVGNTRSYAGGMMITPDAALDDGAARRVRGRPRVARRFPAHVPEGVRRHAHAQPAGHDAPRHARRRSRCPKRSTPPELWASGERVGPLPARARRACPSALRVRHPLDGERAFHALRAWSEDVAVEDVLPRLQVDLLRVGRAVAAHLELEARHLAVVEHQGVHARRRRRARGSRPRRRRSVCRA